MEFQPGAQKNGINGDGADSGPASMENARAESGSFGGFGSCTLMLASIEVRPLYRLGSRAILPTALRIGATCGTEANADTSVAIAIVRSSRVCHCASTPRPPAIEPSRSHRQLDWASLLGSKTWKNRC